MASTFTIKRNDRLPEIQAICQDALGVAVDLTGATGVVFNMKATGGALKITAGTGSIVTPAAGVVKYAWAGTDTDTSGTYAAEFVVTFSGGRTETFPNFENITVTIIDDLN